MIFLNRVVVTGIGICAPGSIGKDIFWENISKGNVYTGPLTMFKCEDLRIKIAGEIKNFTEKEHLKDLYGISFNNLDRSSKSGFILSVFLPNN